MPRKHNSKGRSRSGPSFVQLHHFMLESAAWRSLGVYARCLYVEIRARYNGRNNGSIVMSHREAQALLGCSNKPIPAAFKELEDKGFIRPEQRGSFHWKTRADGSGGLRATTWILTELPQDEPERHLTATKEFMRWSPDKKSRHAESVPLARPKRTISDPMARPKRTNGTPRAYHNGQNREIDGTL